MVYKVSYLYQILLGWKMKDSEAGETFSTYERDAKCL
jgi:hypothetical protein